MRVGLIRHFKVKAELPKKAFISRDELIEWFEEYEQADIEYGQVDMGNISWKYCYSSDIPRAVKTAENIYNGNIVKHQGLRELNPLQLFKRNYKLPFLLWTIIPRIKQMISKDCTADYCNQISSCLNEIFSESDEDILIVSHGFAMIFLQNELKRRGFKGKGFKHPENGMLYVFESN